MAFSLPFIPGINRAPLLVGYFPLKPAGINGVFNKLESSPETVKHETLNWALLNSSQSKAQLYDGILACKDDASCSQVKSKCLTTVQE